MSHVEKYRSKIGDFSTFFQRSLSAATPSKVILTGRMSVIEDIPLIIMMQDGMVTCSRTDIQVLLEDRRYPLERTERAVGNNGLPDIFFCGVQAVIPPSSASKTKKIEIW